MAEAPQSFGKRLSLSLTGFRASGAITNRPALTRLRSDIAAGKVDCVVVYRSDRLSRSIRDFLELMEECDRYGVTFVSVSEQFDTSTPGGRMHRNMLLMFAQYEREVIAERTPSVRECANGPASLRQW